MTEARPALTVLPGVPGMDGLIVDEDQVPYPEGTIDFVKCARQLGVEVQFTEPREARRYVGFKASESWLPILEIARDLLIGVEGALLVELLKAYIGNGEAEIEIERDLASREPQELAPATNSQPPTPQTLLHVDWRVKDGAHESRFRADGDAEAVLQALTAFEENIRDQ